MSDGSAVSVFDSNGVVINMIFIDDDIEYVDGRVSKGSKYYYKGLGTKYQHHFVTDLVDSRQYSNVVKSDVFYMGYEVTKIDFAGKFGIFQVPYQPFFTDFIGSCGAKELSIIENSFFFERSSVEVEKPVKYDDVNHQYYFKVFYHCGRRKYLNYGDPVQLTALISYMLATHWNFTWDKDTITDISYDGRVSDVADIFYSKELKAKFGTVYSVLYSLSRHRKQYYEFLASMQIGTIDCINAAIDILAINKVDVEELFPFFDYQQNRKHIIQNYLINGRNCGDCCKATQGDEVRAGYMRQIGGVL